MTSLKIDQVDPGRNYQLIDMFKTFLERDGFRVEVVNWTNVTITTNDGTKSNLQVKTRACKIEGDIFNAFNTVFPEKGTILIYDVLGIVAREYDRDGNFKEDADRLFGLKIRLAYHPDQDIIIQVN